mgnify:FL=1
MNKQVSYAYQHLSRTETLFKGENKNINISVSKNSPVNASLSLDGYKHSMVQIIALTIALKMKTVIVNPPIVSDTYVFIAIINELGGTAKIYNKRLFIDASTICNANIPFFLGKCIHGSMYLCPALLIALGKFEYYGSGGCQIGDSIDSHNRPFSHIASVIECFNHKISIESNRIIGNFGDNSDITELDIKNFSYSSEDLSGPLVGGATKTALLLSVNKQKFIIKNPYLKTDVYDMIDFLRLIGKKIDISDNSIVCSGNVMASSNQYIEFNLTQCISEIITYSTLALINNTNLTFLDLNKKTISLTLKPEIDILLAMGESIKWERNNLHIQKKGDIKGLNIEVTPTTIQSDHQPFFVLLSLYGSTDCYIIVITPFFLVQKTYQRIKQFLNITI